MFYIFHGEDELTRTEELSRLRGMLAGGDPAMADLNTTVLDGSRLKLGELSHVCDAIPFLADRRLVIVHGLLTRLVPRRRAKDRDGPEDDEPSWRRLFLQDLSGYLPALPPTTRLVFLEDGTLPPSHPLLKLAASGAESRRSFVKHFPLPKHRDLPHWIQQRARGKGGDIDYDAAQRLGLLVGSDLRLLDQEIEKLLLYAGERPVSAKDVELMVSRARETSIFDLVDCVGLRQTDRALRLLHRLLDEGEAPLYLLTMLARQIRILIQVSDLRNRGLTQDKIARQLDLHPYVVEKGLVQAQKFDMAQLEAAHRGVVATDWAVKTGQLEELLALDMLVVKLTHL